MSDVIDEMKNGDVNVYPLDDIGEHVLDVSCSCGPSVEVIGAHLLIVHNAFDHREIIEQAIEILNKKAPDHSGA